MLKSDQRYLIVSLGSIGQRHLRNLRSLRPDSTIAALRLQAAPGDLVPGCDVQLYSMAEVQAFMPQAAIIAGPASTHAAVASALLKMGVAVLIEKPFADSLDGLPALVETARRRNTVLMVGYNLRFKASLIEARRRILDGDIGEVLAVRAEVGQYLPDWRPGGDYRRSVSAQAALGGGALLELSHEIDYLYWLFGLPQRVSCRGGKLSALEIDVEDVVELCLEYEGPRRLVSVHLDFIQRVASRSCKFIGTEGTLTWDGMTDHIEVKTAVVGKACSLDIPTPDKNTMYVDELRHFLACVEDGGVPLIDGPQAFEVLSIVEAAKASMCNQTIERPLSYVPS